MQKELTITIDERLYDQLQRIIGPDHISQFIESLVRPQLDTNDLESSYRAMAEDEDNESSALEWAEATIGDITDEAR